MIQKAILWNILQITICKNPTEQFIGYRKPQNTSDSIELASTKYYIEQNPQQLYRIINAYRKLQSATDSNGLLQAQNILQKTADNNLTE